MATVVKPVPRRHLRRASSSRSIHGTGAHTDRRGGTLCYGYGPVKTAGASQPWHGTGEIRRHRPRGRGHRLSRSGAPMLRFRYMGLPVGREVVKRPSLLRQRYVSPGCRSRPVAEGSQVALYNSPMATNGGRLRQRAVPTIAPARGTSRKGH